MRCSVFIAALALNSLVSPLVHSQERSALKEDSPPIGSRIRKTVSTASIPLRKPYEQFTEAEKDIIRGQYEPSAQPQDPPFPKKGIGPLLMGLRSIAEKLVQAGEIDMVFAIDRNGVAQDVQVMKAPSPEFARYAAAVVMATPFKPATCGGQPCEMEFPLRLEFVLER